MHFSLLFWALALSSSAPSAEAYAPPSLPFQSPLHARPRYIPHASLTRLRDGVLHLIWGKPPFGSSKQASPSEAVAPQSVLDRYGGDVVLRFNITSAEEARSLAEITDRFSLDVWEHTPRWADIRMSKDWVPILLSLLPSNLQRAHVPLMQDLAQAVYESFPSPAIADPESRTREHSRSFSGALHPRTQQEDNIFFKDYQPLSVMYPWLRLMRSLFPTHVRLVNIGTTFEGRDILALRVGVHPTNSKKPKGGRKTVLITGGSHAREWISTAAVNYAAYSLITSYGKDQGLTKLVEEFDWVFVPTMNPDGYVYAWETDRLWRKNRQTTDHRFCTGFDLDRSFSFEWDGEPIRGNECSESYAGKEPLEAVEAQRLASWVKNETEHKNVTFVGFMDFHAYSQQVLYPYSYSCITTPPTLESLEELGLGLAKAIRLADGVSYDVTSACEGSVVSSSEKSSNGLQQKSTHAWSRTESGAGSALDYVYHEVGVRYAYQIKLRDRGSYGFLLPAKEIVPVGKEVFGAVTYLGRFLMGNKGIERSVDSIESQSPSQKPPAAYFTKMDETDDSRSADADESDDTETTLEL